MKTSNCTPVNTPVIAKLFACAALLASCVPALAQTALLSNGSANPGVPALDEVALTGNNTPAPGAAAWSEVASAGTFAGNALAGVACGRDASDLAGGLRVSDDFVVPQGETWNLSSIECFAYQQGSALSLSGATLRIWNGPPGAPGSVVLFGDASTNRLQSVQATSTYRVFTTTVGPTITSPDTSRRVHRVALAASISLTAGTYWLDWQLQPAVAGTLVYAVPVTVAGVRTLPAWNARQLADGAWMGVLDTGKPDVSIDAAQDIAFIVSGTSVVGCDSIDFNQDTLFPDDQDLVDLLTVLAGGACSTGTCSDIDFNNDGLFPDDTDLIAFLSVLAGGPC